MYATDIATSVNGCQWRIYDSEGNLIAYSAWMPDRDQCQRELDAFLAELSTRDE